MTPKTDILLRELTRDDEAAFLAGVEDWNGEALSWITFAWKPGMSHDEHLRNLDEQKQKEKIPAAFVPSTMLYAFIEGKIVGRFNFRHELNDNLTRRGGHIGYAVNPQHRRKGYATEIVRQGLEYCRSQGMKKILITCADGNVASWKIIESFGGTLENRIHASEKDETIRRYWLEL
jgi:predicted acetyltransferase